MPHNCGLPAHLGGENGEGLPAQAWPAPRELLPGCSEPPGERGVASRAGLEGAFPGQCF